MGEAIETELKIFLNRIGFTIHCHHDMEKVVYVKCEKRVMESKIFRMNWGKIMKAMGGRKFILMSVMYPGEWMFKNVEGLLEAEEEAALCEGGIDLSDVMG